jgi:hypothetical protein
MNLVNLFKLAIPLCALAVFVLVLLLWSAGAPIELSVVYYSAALAGLMWTAYLLPSTWWS